MPRTPRGASTEVDDCEKTRSQWKKMSAEALRLKCGEYKLVSTGKKPE